MNVSFDCFDVRTDPPQNLQIHVQERGASAKTDGVSVHRGGNQGRGMYRPHDEHASRKPFVCFSRLRDFMHAW